MKRYLAALLHALANRIDPPPRTLEDVAADWLNAMRTPRA